MSILLRETYEATFIHFSQILSIILTGYILRDGLTLVISVTYEVCKFTRNIFSSATYLKETKTMLCCLKKTYVTNIARPKVLPRSSPNKLKHNTGLE